MAWTMFFFCAALLTRPCVATPGQWEHTGSLNTGRFRHTATLLPDGDVLVAGGLNGTVGYLTSAELYDPATGIWTLTGDLNASRDLHTATLLPNGKVLAAGGRNPSSGYLTSAELYDPATGIWTYTGSLNTARSSHTATLLPNGKVLAAGGANSSGGDLRSAELYDPATGIWTYTGSLNTGRWDHTATLLPNGEVLVAGGLGNGILRSAELYNPGIVLTTVQGRGSVDNQGNEVTFKFRARQSTGDGSENLFTFCDASAGVCITNAPIPSLSFNGNSAKFGGHSRLEDGTWVRFRVSVTDNGAGITDTISVTFDNGYSLSGTLTSGDIRIF